MNRSVKSLTLIAALSASLAAPALAQSQLERDLGVAAGTYSTNQLAQLKAAADAEGNDRTVFFAPTSDARVSSAGDVHSPRASAILNELRAAGDDGAAFRPAAASVTYFATTQADIDRKVIGTGPNS